MPVPKSIKHKDLMEALKPLHDLLRVDPNGIYDNPPMLISGRNITFAAVPDRSDDDGGFPRGTKAQELQLEHPQRDEFGELACIVSVEVEW